VSNIWGFGGILNKLYSIRFIFATIGVMVITYHGKQFFKVSFGDTVIALNPISKDSKIKGARFGADIAVSSMNILNFNGIDAVTYNNKEPFVVAGPGEYEVNGVLIKGYPTQSQYKKEEKINTVYTILLENMTLCFLGGLHTPELSDDIKSALDDVDILFVPVGGGDVLGPDQAHKIATKLEAKMIIPMDYEKDSLKEFLKESGADGVKPVDKLTVKKKDVDGKSGEIIVIKSSV